jgi:hypothetical protein
VLWKEEGTQEENKNNPTQYKTTKHLNKKKTNNKK